MSEAIDGFIKYKVVEGLSPRTLESYINQLARFQDYLDNPPQADITADHINEFLFWLCTDYEPQRLSGNSDRISPKTNGPSRLGRSCKKEQVHLEKKIADIYRAARTLFDSGVAYRKMLNIINKRFSMDSLTHLRLAVGGRWLVEVHPRT